MVGEAISDYNVFYILPLDVTNFRGEGIFV